MKWSLLVTASCSLLLTACLGSPGVEMGGACEGTSECAIDLVCVAGACEERAAESDAGHSDVGDSGPTDATVAPDADDAVDDVTAPDAGEPDAPPDADADTGPPPPCDDACSGTTPVCDVDSDMCVGCLVSTDCTGNPAGDVCDPESKTCAQCVETADCPTGACDVGPNVCVGCTGDTDCAAPFVCDEPAQTCVQCTDNPECTTPGLSVCKREEGAMPACVECAEHSDCLASGDVSEPLCDPATNECVACLDNEDCTSPDASFCSAGVCTGCSVAADCSHLPETKVCDASTCVKCTGTSYTECGGDVCDSLARTCEPGVIPLSGELCGSCVSDAQCPTNRFCVQTTFDGDPAAGYRCLPLQGAGCSRPFLRLITGSSIDKMVGTFCHLPPLTSCEAYLDFVNGKDCVDASECGLDSHDDGACAIDATQDKHCAMPCLVDAECIASQECSADNVCTY